MDLKKLTLFVPLFVSVASGSLLAGQGRSNVPPATPVAAKPVTPPNTAAPAPATTVKPAAPVSVAGAKLPPDYVIGPDDILTVVFWREKELSSEVTVRPDGRISIPLIQDVEAAGLTPEQLRDRLNLQAQRFVEDPSVTVVVKEIHSRLVYITGQVSKAGPYPLTARTTIVQLIAMAGGLLEYADAKNIVLIRTENGAPASYRFNYKDVVNRRNLKQNIELKPGDTVVVP
jgi:polysaccharide export outer membrane protein